MMSQIEKTTNCIVDLTNQLISKHSYMVCLGLKTWAQWGTYFRQKVLKYWEKSFSRCNETKRQTFPCTLNLETNQLSPLQPDWNPDYHVREQKHNHWTNTFVLHQMYCFSLPAFFPLFCQLPVSNRQKKCSKNWQKCWTNWIQQQISKCWKWPLCQLSHFWLAIKLVCF